MIMFIGVVLGILLTIGLPIAFCLGLTSLFTFHFLGNPLLYKLIPQRMFAGIDLGVLMAIPFFIMAGDIMERSGITKGLIDFSNALVGKLRGGLAHVTVVAEIFLSGITGSAIADAAALGPVLIPAMEKEGYDKEFATAVVVASAVIGPIIPPSIPMIIYAVVMQVSVAGLFAAGFIPGILFGLMIMLVNFILSKKRNYPVRREPFHLRDIWSAFRQAFLALIMPIIILGGILGGIFTPTEAAAVAIFYGLIVGFGIMRTLKYSDIPKILVQSVITSSMIFLVLACASVFAWIMASEEIPKKIAQGFLSLTTNPIMILLIINLILFIAGMFMDLGVSIILLGPVLAPVAYQLGVHPLHFAIIMVVNLSIGLITPPVGYVLYVACGITKLSIETITRALIPFIIAECAALIILTYVPSLSLCIPRLLGYVN